MTADVEECFQKIIEKRNPPKAEPMIDGKSGFLYFDKDGSICIPYTGSITLNISFRSIINLQGSDAKCYTACMQTHLLFQYGEVGNESKGITIFDGAFRYKCYIEYVYTCKS